MSMNDRHIEIKTMCSPIRYNLASKTPRLVSPPGPIAELIAAYRSARHTGGQKAIDALLKRRTLEQAQRDRNLHTAP